MTLRCSRNNGPFTQLAEAFYTMKEFWKANGGTKFYTVPASGDGGGGNVSFVSDIITSYLGTSGVPVAGGLNNASSWFVLEEPDGTRQWVFQRYTGATQYAWYVLYSRAGLYVRHGVAAGVPDAFTTNPGVSTTLTLVAAPFTADMVGMKIEISGATNPQNDGVFTVSAQTGGSITYNNTVGVVEAFGGSWGVCAATTTATVRPTATDEQNFQDNAPDSYLSFPSSGSFYMHTVVEGDTPEDDAYPGWMIMRYTGTGLPFGCIMFNCVTAASAIAADSDKMVFFATENDVLDDGTGATLQFNNVNGHNWCYQRYGEVDEAFVRAAGISYVHTGTVLYLPDSASSEPENGAYPLLPVFMVANNAGNYQTKGQSHMWRWNPASAFTFGDLVYDGTEYWMVSDDVILRGWPDNTGPTV